MSSIYNQLKSKPMRETWCTACSAFICTNSLKVHLSGKPHKEQLRVREEKHARELENLKHSWRCSNCKTENPPYAMRCSYCMFGRTCHDKVLP